MKYRIIRSGGVIQAGKEDPLMERIRAAIRGINPEFLDLPEIPSAQSSQENQQNQSAISPEYLKIIKGAIATAQARRHTAALKEIHFQADVSNEDRRKNISVLATTFNKDFGNALKAIKYGKSLGYTVIGDELQKVMLGRQYREPFLEDVAVVTEAIKLFWNEAPFSEDLLGAFDLATKRLSTISNMVNFYIDSEEHNGEGGIPEPHEVVLRDDVFMEIERFSLQGMAEQARDIVRYARPLSGRHI